MLRVIRSTVQGADIDPDLADDYEEAINKALEARAEERETVSYDEIGQKAYRIALLPYTDPTGAHRWAILDDGPSESDWQDTDDLDEAISTYEEWVRGATDGAMPEYDDNGDEKPVWDESDVEGVSAETEYDGSTHNERARLLDAEWAHAEFTAAEQSYQGATRRRQVAFARAIDSWGRGGQSVLAKRVDLKDPTVKLIADKGRQILAQRAAAALPQVTVQDLHQLLDSPAQSPVLYLNNEDGLRVDVWAQALVSIHHVIISQETLLDLVGDDRDDDTLREQLDEIQETVAEIAGNIEDNR